MGKLNLVTLGKGLRFSILLVIVFFASCKKDNGSLPSPTKPEPVKTAPGVPSISSVTMVTAGTVEVAIVAPSTDGGSSITGYMVLATSGNLEVPGNVSVTGTISSDSNKITVTGLKDDGTTYTIQVKAINAVGGSDYSASSGPIMPAKEIANFLMYVKGWNETDLEMFLDSENKWISADLKDCKKDDIYIFKPNGKGSYYQGAQKCDDLPDAGFKWSFNADKTKLAWNGNEMLLTIDILNEDTLRVLQDGVNFNTGETVKFRITYKHSK